MITLFQMPMMSDWGSVGQYMMGGWWGFSGILSLFLALGLTILVWLHVIKIWKEVKK